MLNKIEHVAFAVSDLDAAIDHYRRHWELSVEHREVVEDQQVEEAMLRVGESYIQLLAPTSPTSTIAKFIERRGEGIHHIAYEVTDLQRTLDRLDELGMQVLDRQPRGGSRDTKVAFVHPKANLGTLIELVEGPSPTE